MLYSTHKASCCAMGCCSEPYHQALLCYVCARALCEGGAGPSLPADLVLEVSAWLAV
jgi:hypothetical protein